MQRIIPISADELAAVLRDADAAGKSIELCGNASKRRAGGAIAPADVQVSTTALNQVLIYEPRDLTVSVGAGMSYAAFEQMLAKDGYMVPLDPPFRAEATVGGVISTNSSGPRRRVFGTARDLVIGMKFVTVEGKQVDSGGMVVKNVAGLDMAKLLIGSLGTLAAIAVVNFKLIPRPVGSCTFLFEYVEAKQAMAERDRLLRGVFAPVALDLLNPVAAAGLGRNGWLLAVGCSGNEGVLQRYRRELNAAEVLEGEAERGFWDFVEEYTARFLAANENACVVRSAVTLSELGAAVVKLPGAVIARAGNGVCYSHVSDVAAAQAALGTGKALMEYGPAAREPSLVMWPQVDSGFPIMEKIKQMFDSKNLLNRGRMYGRL